MANLSISKAPTSVNIAGNSIPVNITTSNYWQTSAVTAEVELQIDEDGTSANGKTLIFTFLNFEITMTGVTGTPDESGYQFKYNNGAYSEAEWIEQLLIPALQNNWILNKYYDISVKDGDDDCIVFSSKNEGSDYSLSISGTLSTTELLNTSGVDAESYDFYKILLQLVIDGESFPELSIPVNEETLVAEFDISEFLMAIFDEYFMSVLSSFARVFSDYSTEFMFNYAEVYGTDKDTDYKKTLDSSNYKVIPGKITNRERVNNSDIFDGSFFTSYNLISLFPGNRLISKAAIIGTVARELFYFMNYSTTSGFFYRLHQYLVSNTGSETLKGDSAYISLDKGSVVQFLSTQIPEEEILITHSYLRLKLYNHDGSKVNELDFIIDHNDYLNEEFFYFENNLGVFELLRLTGETSELYNYERENIPQEYYGYEYIDQRINQIIGKKFNTGFLYTEDQIKHLAANFLGSRKIYYYKDNDFYPISINTKKAEFKEKDFLFSFDFDADIFYINQTYVDDEFKSSSQPVKNYKINIYVYDSVTEQPINGASVEVIGEETKNTNSSGYTYFILPNDNYNTQTEKSGYSGQGGGFEISGADDTYNVYLTQL